ncbi:isocitrate lyase/phosphoenolpyruvate mutase family protein [Pseudoflavitalea sp. G-6-1-2]|uniref:isocitrate lyase/PEP mutase family protein n=1 Tax=Pseudoflavitalea sp. G-6-1-2 TaxID=2728841 RepID=UPI00146CAD27|nr:isocitrate lyase/phosphoenolpyruvate mutase family protein [Pseudoflavitalea sp. G-6-1-2]NML23356.1 isocitrate lyase/phosphoenolpyruvate mutase family protein [Pseudoflavitalea sp. G-6-1-2]
MSSSLAQFKALHQASELFVLPNAWNAKSAASFQEQNFSAVGTSSAAVASSLGYDDGEQLPFEEYLLIVRRILASVKIPVTVDIEMGFGNTNEAILKNIQQLVDLGVAGINIEDSQIIDGVRTLKDAKQFAATIEYIKNKLAAKNQDIFINLRSDTYLLNVANKHSETVTRLKLYNNTGADGIFLPCITAEEDIAAAVGVSSLPLNVMCIPGLPDFEQLNKLGVKRASMGPFFFSKVYEEVGQLANAVRSSYSFASILS